MKIHAIVDYSFLYYKYKFQLESGKIRRLTAPVVINGETVEKDVSQVYYSIKEIEGFRRNLEKQGYQVVVSVCFDMPSSRKDSDENATDEQNEAAKQYKANRVKRLKDWDFENIQLAEQLLSDAGHNTYRIDGYEADDIIANLVDMYANNFDFTIIYTSDGDMLSLIKDGVIVQRYKITKGYQSVGMSNFCGYLSSELKCNMPYNALMLFKCTCGDKSDNVKGINKFGPKAFDKLVEYINNKYIDWSQYGNYEKTLELLELSKGYLQDDQITQAKESLSLIRHMVIEDAIINKPDKTSTVELRGSSYMRYNMKSLVD